jgi:hypothetical protein
MHITFYSPHLSAYNPIVKGRSYSTTSLPVGVLASLQERRSDTYSDALSHRIESTFRKTRADKGEVNVKKETTDELREDSEQQVSTSTSSGKTVLIRNTQQQKQFSPRLNLTSDYDSSNDSPSGSDATLDESTSSRFTSNVKNRTHVTSSAQLGETKKDNNVRQSSSRETDSPTKEFRCTLCGGKTKLSSKEKSPVLQPNWPNASPPPPFIPKLDAQGCFVIDGIIYDIEELATDPLLRRINEWDYPIFELHAQTGDAILSHMTYHVFLEAGLLEAFRIPIPEFLNYFRALEQGYRDKPCKI